MTSGNDKRRHGAAVVLMVASGFAALGYQIVWTQQCSLWLGHESAAMLAVVAAFFGGLALGGLALGERIEMSIAPRRWYVGCELVIALWSQLLPIAWSVFSLNVQAALGVDPPAVWHWTVAFLGTFLLLLPATVGMGATLPAMERLTVGAQPGSRSISTLYAGNTLGAVIGVLTSTFWLIPRLGLTYTAAICAGFNLLCAALSLVVFPKTQTPTPRAQVTDRTRAQSTLWRLALTGFLGIGYEVLVVRVLSQVTENTVYTFALLLAVYLEGTAVGAAGYRRWIEGRRDPDETSDRLFGALAIACLLGAASLWVAPDSKRAFFDAFGSSVTVAVAAEATLALLAFGLPTVVMGALFSHLSRLALSAGVSFGRAAGVNVLAAAVAPPVYGVIAVPVFGAKLSLMLVVCGYAVAMTQRAWLTTKAWLPVAAAFGVAFLAPPLRFVEIPAGGRLVDYREGVMASVSVTEDAHGALLLRINNRQQEGSSVTRHVDARQAWLPLLLHAAPERALFLGLGTGVTAQAASEDPRLELDVVELLPEVVDTAVHFTQLSVSPTDRVRIVKADARRYVRVSDRRYDVIVADNFHPARSGSGSLYTVEHFQALRARLASGGVFCQWLPLHQLDLDTLRSIVRSFLRVYPQGAAILASNSLETPVLGLIAHADSQRFNPGEVRARLALPELSRPLQGLGFEDEYAVLGSFVAGSRALARFAAEAPLNTDERPIVAYHAPLVTYAPDSRPRDRLLSLLAELSLEVNELFVPASGAAWERRLAAYWAARDRYLTSGRDVRATPRVEDMLAQVQAPLLDVLRVSPDFRPAYDPLFGMAKALARSNVSAARRLLGELSRLQPARGEAPDLLSQLNATAP